MGNSFKLSIHLEHIVKDIVNYNGKEYTIISYGLSEVGGHRYNNIKKMYCD